ncbi:hypothetical protein [Polaromonas vacuolata]|uniref:hypothetical protein n=1 Tax=Polaromonas vacuolata TaxID=37448 RepID=UPI001456F9F4|nr:hypothetical protein [Polaromonas vacuolata]
MRTAASQILVDRSQLISQAEKFASLIELFSKYFCGPYLERLCHLVDLQLKAEEIAATDTTYLIFHLWRVALEELIAPAFGAFDSGRTDFRHGHGVSYAN